MIVLVAVGADGLDRKAGAELRTPTSAKIPEKDANKGT